MWKQKIGISIGNHYSLPVAEFVNMVKNIGFEAVSLEWEPNFDLSDTVQAAKQHGLLIQSLHAPFGKAADMWRCEEALSVPAKEEVFAALDACILYAIPILVVHTWIGFDYRFDKESLNFQNYDELVSRAKAHNVKIAFENTEGGEYLFALMERYKDDDTVGFCWDSGHEMCYNYSEDLLGQYGDRLIMTHLNDNLGISRFDGQIFWTDDLHLLPYDGIADWDDNIERLKKSRHMDILNFELNMHSKPNRHDNDCYEQMSLEQYFTEAYKRACRIAYRYSK